MEEEIKEINKEIEKLEKDKIIAIDKIKAKYKRKKDKIILRKRKIVENILKELKTNSPIIIRDKNYFEECFFSYYIPDSNYFYVVLNGINRRTLLEKFISVNNDYIKPVESNISFDDMKI